MTTRTLIANRALIRLGAKSITSLTDGSREAREVNAIYDLSLEDLLNSANWGFARRYVQLARSSNTPDHAYEYQYPLPVDWVRTLNVWNNSSRDGVVEYKHAWDEADKGVIVSDSDQIYLSYLSSRPLSGDAYNAFNAALAEKLAYELCITFTQSVPLYDRLERSYQRARGQAMALVEQQDYPTAAPYHSEWISVRE